MQIVFPGFRIPADEGVSGCDLPGGRAPAQAGHWPLIDKGNVLEMVADDLTIAEVMVLLNQRVVERLKLCVSDWFEINRGRLASLSCRGV